MKCLHQFVFLLLVLFSINVGYSQNNTTDKKEDYIIRKGRYYSSLTFSLSQRKAENEDQLLRQIIDQNRYDYRIIGNGGYAIKDNFTLGLSAAYGRKKEEISFLDENDEQITSKSVEQGFSFTPNIRNYIPIGKGQLQIIVQTQLGFTFGESLERVYSSSNVDKVEGDFIEIDIGVSPGVVLFFNRNWAFETRVNVAGLNTRIEEQVTNDDEESRQRIEQTNIDLKLNLLALNLGVAFYF